MGNGRGDGIRTHGFHVPNVALYQTEPHLVAKLVYHRFPNFASPFGKTFNNKFPFEANEAAGLSFERSVRLSPKEIPPNPLF